MLKIIFSLIILNVICVAQPIQIPILEFSPKEYTCYKSGEEIIIDGKLNESG